VPPPFAGVSVAAQAEEEGVPEGSSMSESSSSKRPESLLRKVAPAVTRRGVDKIPSSRYRRGVLQRLMALLVGGRGGSMLAKLVSTRGEQVPHVAMPERGLTPVTLEPPPLGTAHWRDKLAGLSSACGWPRAK